MTRFAASTPGALLLLLLLTATTPTPSAAQGPQAWQLVEIVDYAKSPDGGYSLGYGRGAITLGWTLNRDAWVFTSTWSAPPETIRPGDRVTIDFQVTTTRDVGDEYSAGGSFALFFDRPDIEPGSAGSPIGFTNDKGEGGGVDVRHRVKSPPVARRVWVDAATLGAGRPGARIALLAVAYNGRTAGTKYIYEWRGPLSPEEKKRLLPPAPAAPPAPSAAARPAPSPPLPGLRDSGARFSSLSGEVEVYHEGQTRKDARFVKLDTVLYYGDHVITGDESSAIIGFSDLTTHLQKENTEVVLTEPRTPSMVRLVAGNIWRNIKKMVKDGTMEVEMWDAAASVKGTTLVCESTPAGSTVKVIEGVVEVRSRTRAQSVTLAAGTMVRSSAKGLEPVQSFDVAAESASWDAIRAGDRRSPSPTRAGSNLALGGHATQSSTAFNGAAERAIDGNTDGAFPRGSVTHTGNRLLEWWQVDLGASREIDRVVISNRTDCCGERLRSFWVLVSDTPFPPGAAPTGRSTAATWRRQVPGVAGPATEVRVGARGRYVRIQLDEPDYLSLAEVQVLGR